VLAAFATGFCSPLTIIDKIASVTTAGLTAFTSGFCGPLTVFCEVPGTVLPADMASACGLFAILGKVSWISGVAFFCHRLPLSAC
jgi:hypothetical protein